MKSARSIESNKRCLNTTRTVGRSFDPRRRVRRRLLLYRLSTSEKLSIHRLKDIVNRMEEKKVLNEVFSPASSLASLAPLQSVVSSMERRLQSSWLMGRLRMQLDQLLLTTHKQKAIASKGSLREVDKLSVYRLVRFSALKLLPTSLLGSSNLNRLLNNFKLVLGTGKGGQVALASLMRGLDPQKVPWMPTNSELCEQHHLMSKVVLFVTEDVLWQVVLAFFQISETSHRRNELCFYRKRHFQAFFQTTLHRLESSGQLKRLKSKSKLSALLSEIGNPSIADCRLLPKRLGSRIIARERHKSAPCERQQIDRVTIAKLLLVHIKRRYTESVDSCGRDLFRVWSNFLEVAKDKEVFAVFVDVKDAYDSIQLSKLSSILTALAEEFRSPSLFIVSRLSKNGRRRFLRVVERDKALPSDRIVVKDIDPKQILKEVIQRCHQHVLCFSEGRKSVSYIRRRGIPQGDVLSSALCNIYYGTMFEKEIWPHFKGSQSPRVIMRAVDDFVFASTARQQAEKFLELMSKGFESYGCQIQAKKTLVNFSILKTVALRNEGSVAIVSDDVSFCGAIINMRSKEVKPDFSSYFDLNIAFAMKLNCPETMPTKQFILVRMLFLCTLKLNSCFLDETVNSVATARKNVFEVMYVLALRFHALISSLMVSPESVVELTDPPLAHYVIKIILSCHGKVAVHIKNLSKNNKGFQTTITDSQMKYFLFEAFSRVLQRRAAIYGSACIKELKRQMRSIVVDNQIKMWAAGTVEERGTDRIISQPVFKLK